MENVKEEIDEHTLQDLYAWVDQIPLTRPKRNLSRDFSDGVLMAEVVAHYYPKMVEMHNYSPANSTRQKMDNWRVLNRKVFKKFDFELSEDIMTQASNGRPFVIERLLLLLRSKLENSSLPDQAMASPIPSQQPALTGSGAPSQSSNSKGQEYAGAGSPRKDAGKPIAANNGVSSSLTKKPPSGTTNQQAARSSAPGNAGDSTVGKPGSKAGGPLPTMATAATSTVAYGDTVPRMLLEEKEQQCLAQEETIQILQAKVRRLEHLLQLKDIRINDMQAQLEALRPTGTRR